MHRSHLLHRFEFDNNLFIHNRVQSIATIQIHSLIREWQIYFFPKWNFANRQFMTKACGISRFEESWPERTMNFNGCANDQLA